MLKIDVYHSAGTARVSLHHHPASSDDRCGDDCYEYARQRTYSRKGQNAHQYREEVVAAVSRALRTSEIGHAEFCALVGEQLTLF